MKAIKFTGFILAAILSNTRLMAQEQLVVPLSDPGKAYKLNVGLTSGSIKVSGYDGKDVVIDVTGAPERNKNQHETENGMKRLSGGQNVAVNAREKNNEINVDAENMKTVNLELKVPKNATSIKLSTVNNGNINVNDVSGALEIQNVNGFISALNISGSVVANTVNGKVLVTFKNMDPKAAMAFSTLNGNVDVTFPTSLKANLKIRSDQGQVYSDFDMATDSSHPKATKTAKDGMYRLTIEDWIYGKVAGGGPEILMKNMNGNIYLHKVK